MAVPGWPSPAFWMASMARVRTVSTARVSRSVPRAVSVVTAAPRGRVQECSCQAFRLPAPRGASCGSAVLVLGPGAGLDAPAQGQLPQPLVGRDPALALGRLGPVPAAVLRQLPGLH